MDESEREEGGRFEGRFKRLRDYFRRRPASALRTLYSDVVRMEGYHSIAETEEFTVEADEPEGLGGSDKAPTPTQILLSAMSHCQAITLKIYADGMGLKLDDVKVRVTGTVDLRGYFSVPGEDGEQVEPALEEVIMKTYIESGEPEERILDLVKATEGKGVCLSSVKPVKGIRKSYRLNGEKLRL